MRIIRSAEEWRKLRSETPGSWGFVPTMGALHAGHISLVEQSRRENDFTIVSIFVNPTQFNDPKDFETYPQTWDQDCRLLEQHKVDVVLSPTYAELYADEYRFKLSESEDSRVLCGRRRHGHFEGVLTVVLKLLNLTQAHRAYFGEKDYQQYRLIEQMAKALFLPTRICSGPTVREADGLAMSSRNLRLTPEERKKAPLIFELLNSSKPLSEVRQKLEAEGFKVEYLEEHWGRRFIAAHLGSVRLIDNVAL